MVEDAKRRKTAKLDGVTSFDDGEYSLVCSDGMPIWKQCARGRVGSD